MYTRILKEFNEILEKYCVIPINESIYDFFIILKGNKNTPYENIPFVFKFHIPETYPFVPPVVIFIPFTNEKIHPNLYLSGRVCLSLLKTYIGPNQEAVNRAGWSPVHNLCSIIISIQSLFNEQPLIHEPCVSHTQENIKKYNDKIKNILEKSLSNYIDNLQVNNKDVKNKLKTMLYENQDS